MGKWIDRALLLLLVGGAAVLLQCAALNGRNTAAKEALASLRDALYNRNGGDLFVLNPSKERLNSIAGRGSIPQGIKAEYVIRAGEGAKKIILISLSYRGGGLRFVWSDIFGARLYQIVEED
ncbi:MAG: hypothetical protein D6808_04155 [Candidatus Dadabacteria bacterium]|nr:MAG: hypothetical protein D6808_04155 [Candidatus Dadabacteria bacterium]